MMLKLMPIMVMVTMMMLMQMHSSVEAMRGAERR